MSTAAIVLNLALALTLVVAVAIAMVTVPNLGRLRAQRARVRAARPGSDPWQRFVSSSIEVVDDGLRAA